MDHSWRSRSWILLLVVLLGSLLFLGPAPAPASAALPAPASLTLTTAGTTQINLTWGAVSGATSYQIYRSTGSSTTFTKIATLTTRTYNNTALTAGTRYNYKVRALQSSTPGAFTAVKSAYTKPAAPTGLTAVATSTSQINLAWNAVTSATSYQVWRATGSSTTYTKVATVTTASYNNMGLASGTKYSYKVYAANSGGTGSASTPVVCNTKPGTPSGVTATKLSGTTIRVGWNTVSGATAYKVYMSKNGGAYTLKKVLSAPTLAYSVTELTAGSYTFKVAAVSGTSQGASSAATKAIPLPVPLLVAPADFSVVTRNFQSVNVYYDAVQNATTYRIYHSKTPSSNLADYDYDEYDGSGQPACYIYGLDANTTYYFRVAAIDSYGRVGTPTGYLPAKTSASPGNPPQPKFYLNSMDLGSSYRMNLYRGTNPIYYSAYDPSFDFYVGTSSTNMTYVDTADLTQYFYYDCPPGQDRWYGFVAKYGPLESTMQKLNIAALAPPSWVTANGTVGSGTVNMSWASVSYVSSYHIYWCVGAPYPGQSWFDFKTSAGSLLHYYGSFTGTSRTLTGITPGLQYYFFVVPASASGAESWFCKFAQTSA